MLFIYIHGLIFNFKIMTCCPLLIAYKCIHLICVCIIFTNIVIGVTCYFFKFVGVNFSYLMLTVH